MTKDGSDDTLVFKEHKPGFVIKENSVKYWWEHEKEFEGWELYCPDEYINKIKTESLIANVDEREFINFDSHWLLSIFKSLNPD